jgi:hypothetical protein
LSTTASGRHDGITLGDARETPCNSPLFHCGVGTGRCVGCGSMVRWSTPSNHDSFVWQRSAVFGCARLRSTAPSHERAARSHRDEVRRTPLTALLRVLLVLADDHSMSTLTVLSS